MSGSDSANASSTLGQVIKQTALAFSSAGKKLRVQGEVKMIFFFFFFFFFFFLNFFF
jgi:hypothetical protein